MEVEDCLVVPYIGTWIETSGTNVNRIDDSVVPYIGTWIETTRTLMTSYYDLSYLI